MCQEKSTLQQHIEDDGIVIVVANELETGVDMLNHLANRYTGDKGVVGQDCLVDTVCAEGNPLSLSIKDGNNNGRRDYRELVEEVVKSCSSVVAVVDSEQKFDEYMDAVVESSCGGVILADTEVFSKVAHKSESMFRAGNGLGKSSNTFKGVIAGYVMFLDENGEICNELPPARANW
ncbi:hypothetical protein [Bacillus cereus]|uniref:hypothetical protein n=1 Tax=Bacillus cereus TaxID=1396 RepID=UPI000BFBB7E3|nr:hypothetical protein [Bacillus cereus]PGR83604.1 hypothetical protein COC63_06355 [Bacillus cereus]